MRPLKCGWLLCSLSLLHAGAWAQLTKAGPDMQTACAARMQRALPEDIARAATPAEYPTCDWYALYDAKKFAEARTCAIQERAAPGDTGEGKSVDDNDR